MDDSIQTSIEKIIQIPHEFYRRGDISEYALLKESGYFDLFEKIWEKEIVEALHKHPSVISEWLQLSDDSRSSSRWGFAKFENGECIVGHWPPGKEFQEFSTYDEFEGCAVYIKRHIESIRI